METAEISALLAPFVTPGDLSSLLLEQVAAYLRLLMRWNARINLTAVRSEREIVSRHFGESFFLARVLSEIAGDIPLSAQCFDLGSGAGFPGLPLQLYCPRRRVTLIESNGKKAAFLNEVIRELKLSETTIFAGRAETLLKQRGGDSPENSKAGVRAGNAGLVTMRAVERFVEALPVAVQLLAPKGRLALLIGEGQITKARTALPEFDWHEPVAVPLSTSRVVLTGSRR